MDDRSFYNFLRSKKSGNNLLYYYQLDYLIRKLKNYKMPIPEEILDWKNNNIIYDPVTNIINEVSQVYDLTVPDDNSYLGNGIVNHNCQGSTLDYAILDIGYSIFQEGQAYVALSRSRTLEGILLIDFMPKKVYANETTLEYEEKLIKIEEENIRMEIENKEEYKKDVEQIKKERKKVKKTRKEDEDLFINF
jgi:hypothetical protein